ncbi:MAG: Histidine triad nucleotide-binding protein [Acidimicrobiales bacterium]|jgi:histidine triad (HIT) family protein|nr:Histidine triad nucleotide-binding protein [Acidimicrobiales bacterium]
MSAAVTGCVFCEIVAGQRAAHIVWRSDAAVAFLDMRPVFPGHTLVVPPAHVVTLPDLPVADVGPYFVDVQRLSVAVPAAMSADGSFVAINNVVSQSVAHLHTHVVPRRRKDGLRGFFWPRQKYESEDAMADVAGRIRDALSVG